MQDQPSERPRAKRLPVALGCGAAALAAALAVGWPRAPRGTVVPELPRHSVPSGGARSEVDRLRAALEEAAEQHLAAALEAGVAGATDANASASARARAAGLAAELLERWRRAPVPGAGPELERFALLSSALAVLHEPILPEERSVASELRVLWLELLLQRAIQEEGTERGTASPAAPERAAGAGSPGSLAAEGLRLDRRSDGSAVIAARRASPAALLRALLASFVTADEPPLDRAYPAPLEVHARHADPVRLARDLAGSIGLLGPLDEAPEEGARVPRWHAWEDPLGPADREALLRLVLTQAIASEAEPLGEAARCEARFLRGRAHEELGSSTEALAEYAALVDAHPQRERVPQALSRSARIHVARGELELAQAAWERLVERHPEAPGAAEALLLSADLCASRGLTAAARQRYERILQRSSAPEVAAAARLGRLAIRFATELERATPRQLQQLAAALAREADARRQPALRARYLALSAELFQRVGATPLALRETLAALEEARDAANRERSALAAAELALALRLPLAALWSLERGAPAESARTTTLRAAALERLGWSDLPTASVAADAAPAAREGSSAVREPCLAPGLEQDISDLRARCAALESPR